MKNIISILKVRSEEVKEVNAKDMYDENKCENEEISKQQSDMSYFTSEIENFIKEDVVDVVINNLTSLWTIAYSSKHLELENSSLMI